MRQNRTHGSMRRREATNVSRLARATEEPSRRPYLAGAGSATSALGLARAEAAVRSQRQRARDVTAGSWMGKCPRACSGQRSCVCVWRRAGARPRAGRDPLSFSRGLRPTKSWLVVSGSGRAEQQPGHRHRGSFVGAGGSVAAGRGRGLPDRRARAAVSIRRHQCCRSSKAVLFDAGTGTALCAPRRRPRGGSDSRLCLVRRGSARRLRGGAHRSDDIGTRALFAASSSRTRTCSVSR